MIRLWFIGLLCLSSAVSADQYKYDQKNDRYTMIGQFKTIMLLERLSFDSGIEIKLDADANKKIIVDLESVSEKEVITFFDQEYSTVKSYIKKDGLKELVSLTILPKGKYQSNELITIVRNSDIGFEYTENASGYNPKSISRFQERIKRLELDQKKRYEKELKRKKDRVDRKSELHEKKRKKYEKEKKEVVEELKRLKSEDQLIYERTLNAYSIKFPNIKKQVEDD